MAVKNFNLKNATWWTAAIWKIEKLQYLMMVQSGYLKLRRT